MNIAKYIKGERLMTIENLGMNYGPKTIFRDINLKIDNITRPEMKQGQVVSLLGPSGIGKTQFFRCISALQRQTTGSVIIEMGDGAIQKQTSVQSGDIGVVFQNYPLLKHRTIIGNLMLAAKKGGHALDEVYKYLEQFELADKANLYPIQLSGGQRQRVAIIQQLLCSSYFLLMDEPFSGLDIIMKQTVCDVIQKVTSVHEKNTIIITTHDIETAVAISDTIWVMGYEHDKGDQIHGSTIIKEIDLIERDLSWHADIQHQANFFPTVLEIKSLFRN